MASKAVSSPKGSGMTFTTRKRIGSLVTSVVMILVALVCAVPLWYIVINTFKTIPDMASNPLGLPKEWTLANYTKAFATVPIVRSLWNTLVVTFFGVVIQVGVGALAAYGMILRKSRFTALVGMILMVAFVVPAQTTLIPLYRMEAQAHLVNTLAGLTIIYLGGAVFCYFLIVGYMKSLPFELIEAARIDGAGPLRIFWSIVLPMARPAIVTISILSFQGSWNELSHFIVSTQSSALTTLTKGVASLASGQLSAGNQYPVKLAAAVVMTIPVAVLFFIFQKQIMNSSEGSVKE